MRFRAGSLVGLCALLTPTLAVTLAATATVAQTRLERTEPGHLRPPPPGGYDLPLAPPVVSFPLPPEWVTIRSDEDWRKAGSIDKELSRACSLGDFHETLRLRFRAYYKKDILGVAFGYGLNLTDLRKLADPKMIYLFRNGDSTGCVVLATPNRDPNVINAGKK